MALQHSFQVQHQSLMGIGAQIVQAMSGAGTSEEGLRQLRRLVARFKGALLVHQRMENDALYPRLMSHPDPAIAAEARALYADLGGIYDQFAELEERFGSSEIIVLSVPEYVSAVRRLLKRLFARMQREDAELYPLASRANLSQDAPSLPPEESQLSVLEERERWVRGLPQ